MNSLSFLFFDDFCLLVFDFGCDAAILVNVKKYVMFFLHIENGAPADIQHNKLSLYLFSPLFPSFFLLSGRRR